MEKRDSKGLEGILESKEPTSKEIPYEEIVRRMDKGVVMTNDKEEVIYVNPAFVEQAGYSFEEIKGIKSSQFIVKDKKEFKKELKKRRQGEESTYDLNLVNKQGENVDVNISAFPLFDENNNYSGSFGILTDKTQEKEAQKYAMLTDITWSLAFNKTFEKNEFLDNVCMILTGALGATRTCFHEQDDLENMICTSEHTNKDSIKDMKVPSFFWKYFTKGEAYVMTIPDMREMMKNDQTIDALEKKNLENVAHNIKKEWDLKSIVMLPYRINNEVKGFMTLHYCEGKEKPNSETELKFLKEVAKIISLSLTHRDAEDKLTKSEEKYRKIIESLPQGYVEFDTEGKITFLNQGLCNILKYEKKELENIKMSEVIGHEKIKDFYSKMEELKGKDQKDFDCWIKDKQGNDICLEASLYSITNEENYITGYNGTIQDITERKINEDFWKEKAEIDSLTGLYNRGTMDKSLEQEIQKANQKETPLSLILLDIDHFKKYNDTYGHTEGDKALSKVAEVLHNTTREDNIVCRYGGEEFAVILPNTNYGTAEKVSERIRNAVEDTKIGQDKNLTISAGFSTYDKNIHRSMEDFLTSADKGLYMSKHNGRNCVSSEQETNNILEQYHTPDNKNIACHSVPSQAIRAMKADIKN